MDPELLNLRQMWSIRSRGGKKDEARKAVTLNQTWVHSLACGKDNLLTLACSEGKYSVYLQAPKEKTGTS